MLSLIVNGVIHGPNIMNVPRYIHILCVNTYRSVSYHPIYLFYHITYMYYYIGA